MYNQEKTFFTSQTTQPPNQLNLHHEQFVRTEKDRQ